MTLASPISLNEAPTGPSKCVMLMLNDLIYFGTCSSSLKLNGIAFVNSTPMPFLRLLSCSLRALSARHIQGNWEHLQLGNVDVWERKLLLSSRGHSLATELFGEGGRFFYACQFKIALGQGYLLCVTILEFG